MLTDKMHVVHPRAAGLDVHKMEITATVRLCSPEGGDSETEAFSILESRMRDLVAWLLGHGVTAAEATGLGTSALKDAGVDLLHGQHVKQGPEKSPTAGGWPANSVWRLRVWSCRASSGVCAC